jgi:O-antigen/teichoic acid export membrane protein
MPLIADPNMPPPRLSRVTRNFIANLAGSGWTALIGLICTPLYIKFMGMEAYGLVGFYFMLQGVVQLLDLGLSPTMNREMARYSVLPEKTGEARDLVRTLEVGYWAIGALIGLSLYLSAPFVATHWIKAGDLPAEEVRQAVAIMGLLAALQWPLSIYQGGLIGLQQQVLLNGINIAVATLSGVGALLALWLVSPTVQVFFTWQIVVGALQVLFTTLAFWRCLPSAGRPARFAPSLLRNIWRFAAGVSGIMFTALILMQLDKVMLSKLLPLKTFGYYILASVVANGLTILVITPMFNTVFPRFSSLVEVGEDKKLSEMYHGSTQIMAILILPAAAVLALFSQEIILLWTGNPDVAANCAPIVSILVTGTALNGLMNLPFALQLAYGWTRIGLKINTVFIFTMVPAILYLAPRYGGQGAAMVWVALNAIYMIVGVPLTHRRLLKGEALRWFLKDVGLPMAATMLVTLACRRLIYPPTQHSVGLATLGFVWLTAAASTAITSPSLRAWFFEQTASWTSK